ncbi:MAG: cache domain-containing sensor histidine kinase [Bacillota bacterium]
MRKISSINIFSRWGNIIRKLNDKAQIQRKSFRFKLIVAFYAVSIVPVIIIQLVLYYNIVAIIQSNVDELVDINLVQTQKSIGTVLSSYEDILYQMYTNDNIVELVDKINAGQDVEVNVNQLRRNLHGLANVKPHIQSITVMTDCGEIVFYDKLATSTARNAWMDTIGISQDQLYQKIISTNKTTILSTRFASEFSLQPYYLFHMAHRIIDYRNISKKSGVIILSIDEKLLDEVCNEDLNAKGSGKSKSVNFIVDSEGKIVSFPDKTKIGLAAADISSPEREQIDGYKQLISDSNILAGEHITVHVLWDEKLGWNIINATDRSEMFRRIADQQKITVLVVIFSGLTLIALIILITNRLTGSIRRIIKAMKIAERGELSFRMEEYENMSIEFITIAEQFNHMMGKINELLEEVRMAGIKQKNAEIAALEAQINPHFLYNILDTINWMAIEREQYEISNTISSLGRILRYGIDKSNSMVEIRQEVEWLKQYVFLQQIRLKNMFECKLHIDPNVLGFHIHKLLFQPFVENAILHGFEGVKSRHELVIEMKEKPETIEIIIKDNGKGMRREMTEQLNNDIYINSDEKSYIGIRNAVGRLKLYYGDKSGVRFQSEPGEGTTIFIEIPKQ